MKEDNDIDKESVENSQNSKAVNSAENNIGSYDLEKLPLNNDSEIWISKRKNKRRRIK